MRSISMPQLAEAATPVRRPVPANSQRRGRRARATSRACSPRSLPRYWTPSSAASGRPRSRHCLRLRQHVAALDDPPEEVVGREEREVAAEVAVALDDVVLVRRDVLVVAGEDDQVVGARELARRSRARRGPRRRGRRRPAPSARASAGTAGRSGGSGTARRGSGTGGRAAPSWSLPVARTTCRRPVAVVVAEVVGLPRVRRQDDGHTVLAEPRGPDDERREAHAAVGGVSRAK